MLRRSIFNIAMWVLAAVLTVWTVAGPVARGAVKAGGKTKGDKAAKEVSKVTDSGGAAAKEEAAKGDGAKGESGGKPAGEGSVDEDSDDQPEPVRKTDREWKRQLSPKEYRVTRQKETELPFSGKYVHTKKEGVYRCVCCGAKLFASNTKFDSGTGWPSFYAPVKEKAVATAADYSDGAPRLEVTCTRCDAHLGHVFADGPAPTGLRYCINSLALKLEETPKAGSTPGAKSNTAPGKPDGKKPSRDK